MVLEFTLQYVKELVPHMCFHFLYSLGEQMCYNLFNGNNDE